MLPSAVLLALCSLIIHSLFQYTEALVFNVRSFSNFSLKSRAGTGSSTGGSVSLADKSNTQYVANITVGGSDFAVIIDTGSSDLWISGNPQLTSDTGVQVGLQYAIGNATGTINTAAAEFAGEAIANQSYLLVKDTSSFGNLAAQGIQGLIGLGPSTGSTIKSKLGNNTGGTVLDNIFTNNPSLPNYISFQLQRNVDSGTSKGSTSSPGIFTIGEVAPGDTFSSITSQPKLPVQVLDEDTSYAQHWTVQLDEDGIIGPDGKSIDVSSIVKNNNGKLFAVVDSGFTLPQVPRKVSDAIYGRVQGAEYDTKNELWTVPCQQELNISFKLGGVTFPVHPLDTISSDFGLKDENGNDICVGTFQPITSAFSLYGEFDLILGMAFLRNAYTLLSFGSLFTPPPSSSIKKSTEAPFIQLLSTTTPTVAHQAFVNSRLKGVDTTGAPQFSLLSKGKKSPVPLDERIKHTEQKVIRYRAAIGSSVAVVVLLLIGLIWWRFAKRRRLRREREAADQRKVEMRIQQQQQQDYEYSASATALVDERKYSSSAYDYSQPLPTPQQPVHLGESMYRSSLGGGYDYGYQQQQQQQPFVHYQHQQVPQQQHPYGPYYGSTMA